MSGKKQDKEGDRRSQEDHGISKDEDRGISKDEDHGISKEEGFRNK